MAASVWPDSLPQKPLTDGYGESQQPNKIRTGMGIGPAKQRRRFTKEVENIDATWEVDATQKDTFLDFYRNTLGGGADKFDITHPSRGITVEMRFRTDGGDDYTVENIGADRYRITTRLEVV